jgi:hypothetical protein
MVLPQFFYSLWYGALDLQLVEHRYITRFSSAILTNPDQCMCIPAVLFMFTSLWQSIYHYSTINAAIRFLPVGVIAGLVAPFVSVLAGKIPAKRIALPSLFLMFVATLLLPFADQRARYWSLVFPAFVIGSGATMGLYIVTRFDLFMHPFRSC